MERLVNNNFGEPLEKSLDRLRERVLIAAQSGAELIVLEDLGILKAGNMPIDPAAGNCRGEQSARGTFPRGCDLPSFDQPGRLERRGSEFA